MTEQKVDALSKALKRWKEALVEHPDTAFRKGGLQKRGNDTRQISMRGTKWCGNKLRSFRYKNSVRTCTQCPADFSTRENGKRTLNFITSCLKAVTIPAWADLQAVVEHKDHAEHALRRAVTSSIQKGIFQ